MARPKGFEPLTHALEGMSNPTTAFAQKLEQVRKNVTKLKNEQSQTVAKLKNARAEFTKNGISAGAMANKQSAMRAVKAKFNKLKRGTASLSLKLAQGEPNLMPEMPVTIQGFKPEIDSTEWLVIRVVNELNKNNAFTTGLEMELK